MKYSIQRNYPNECVAKTSDSKIVIEERNSKICFLNPKRKKYEIVHVDGGVIANTQEIRCDYLLAKYDNFPKVECFIELKGVDQLHGIKQLEATIVRLSVDTPQLKKYAFLIFLRKCTLTTTLKQNCQLRFKEKFKVKLLIEKTGYKHALY